MKELTPEDFKIGLVIRLKSQTFPKMTVEKQDLNTIYVVYFDKNSHTFKRDHFDYALLILA